jgi:hypothetical protein
MFIHVKQVTAASHIGIGVKLPVEAKGISILLAVNPPWSTMRAASAQCQAADKCIDKQVDITPA